MVSVAVQGQKFFICEDVGNILKILCVNILRQCNVHRQHVLSILKRPQHSGLKRYSLYYDYGAFLPVNQWI